MRTKIIALILCTVCAVSVVVYLLIAPEITVHDGNKMLLVAGVDTSNFRDGNVHASALNNSTMTLYDCEMEYNYLMINGQWNTTVTYLGIVDVYNPQATTSADSNIISRTFYCPDINVTTTLQYWYHQNGTRIEPGYAVPTIQDSVQVSAYGWTKP